MNDVRRAVVEDEEDNVPQVRVVSLQNGAANGIGHPATLKLPRRVRARLRPELAALDWARRAVRLAGGK